MPKMGFEHAAEQQGTRLGELLWDIHAAAMKIVEFTTGRDYDDFAGNELLRSIVASMLQIIAGSLRSLQTGFPDEFIKISNGLRLIEAGFPTAALPEEKLWRIVEEQIPDLLAESRAILEDWHQA